MRRPIAVIAALATCLIGGPAALAGPLGDAYDEGGSNPVGQLVAWIEATRDNGEAPYIVVDKTAAQVFVFGADGSLLGQSEALLGFAQGDDSIPGIGDRALEAIRPEERTTPAGRFVASYGPADGQADVFWVDYATAISLHPVPTGKPQERRLQRLRSPSPQDNRITYGCINVPAAFYASVVKTTFRGRKGVVYVLPETRLFAEVFPAAMAGASSAADVATTVSANAEAHPIDDVWKRLEWEPRDPR